MLYLITDNMVGRNQRKPIEQLTLTRNLNMSTVSSI